MSAPSRQIFAGPLDPDGLQGWRRIGVSAHNVRFIYHLFDARRGILYVGMTWNIYSRWTQHRLKKPWWSSVAYAEVYQVTETDSAEADYVTRELEAQAIEQRRPPHNKQGIHAQKVGL